MSEGVEADAGDTLAVAEVTCGGPGLTIDLSPIKPSEPPCTHVLGSARIIAPAGYRGDLSKLRPLRRVDGSLIFAGWNYTSLAGMEELTVIGGGLHIGGWMPHLRELRGLRAIGEDLSAVINGELETFDGLQSVKRLKGLKVVGNASLRNLVGLESLEVVEGDVFITDNPNLEPGEVSRLLSHVRVTGQVKLSY